MNKKLSSFLSFAMLKSSSIDWLLLLTILTKYNQYHLPFLIDGEKVEIIFLKDGGFEPLWSINPSWSSHKYLISTQEKMRLFALSLHCLDSNIKQE